MTIEKTTDMRWLLKMSGVMARQRDPLLVMLQHYFFNDGKGKLCELECDLAGGNAGIAAGVGLIAFCGGLTLGSGGLAGGPCVAGITGVFTASTVGAFALSSGYIGAYVCKQEMCSE
jgi:type IV secretory pathway VirB2 component (pilin)